MARKVSAIQSASRARRQVALALREQGLTLKEIGERLGVSDERARQIIVRAKRDNADAERAAN